MRRSYLVKKLIQEKPEVLQVVTEFEPLARRTELSLEDINSSVCALGSSLFKMKKELEKPAVCEEDHFNEQMASFCSKANEEVAALREEFAKTQQGYAALCARFGENAKTVKSTEFFGYIVTFLSVVKQSHKHLLDLQAEEKLKKVALDWKNLAAAQSHKSTEQAGADRVAGKDEVAGREVPRFKLPELKGVTKPSEVGEKKAPLPSTLPPRRQEIPAQMQHVEKKVSLWKRLTGFGRKSWGVCETNREGPRNGEWPG